MRQKKHLYEKTAHRVAKLAGQALPLVLADPDHAYALSIEQRLRDLAKKNGHDFIPDNEVGAALRQLKDQGYLTSEEVDHPDWKSKNLLGRPKVVRYTLTTHGMFMLSLATAMVAAQAPIAQAA